MEWETNDERRLCTIDDGQGEGGAGGAGSGGDQGAGGAGSGDATNDNAGTGGGASDGAAGLLAGNGGNDGAGAGDGASGAGGGDGAGGAGNLAWLDQFSAEGGDADNPSNRDWLKAKGFKSIDDVAASYREAEKALRSGGKFTVPGEKATPEEIAAFRSAIGVPAKAEDYAIKVPEGQELDASFADPMRAIALEAGVPSGAFSKLAEGFIQWQADQLEATRAGEDQDAQAAMTAWGTDKDAKMADAQRAMAALGITAIDVAGMQRGLASVHGKPGSGRMLNLLARLGAGMAEDVLIGGGRGRFGITAAEAQAEITRLSADEEFRKKLIDKDPAAVQRWNRLNDAVAAEVDRQERAARAE